VEIQFVKYQGTGNDFVMIDNTNNQYPEFSIDQVAVICNRRFGVGADGLIILEKDSVSDFKMNYYNADGSQSFCGNGGRCAVAFAYALGMISKTCSFVAIDGIHYAEVIENEVIKLKMGKISRIEKIDSDYFIHTGSPHYVRFNENSNLDIVEFGKSIRYSERYIKDGTNVNLAKVQTDCIEVQTYERGVEDETLSCGTGVTAVALIYASLNSAQQGKTPIKTKGGLLSVYWEKNEGEFNNVYLEGAATRVYEGQINI